MSRENVTVVMVAATLAVCALLASIAPCTTQAQAQAQAPVYDYAVVAVRSHDATAFTQGLAYHDGYLVESTGLNGVSSLRKVSLASGRVRQRVNMSARYFAEGATVLRNRVYQLTWRDRKGFVYDLRTFRRLRTFGYSGEGWGLTNDGVNLIMSDGTDTLRFLDPATLGVRRTLAVRDGANPVSSLNELEVVKGRICANVYPSDRIACIDPKSGNVRYWIDLARLLPASQRPDKAAVANGIAYDAKQDRLFVTGKLWPRLYQISLRTSSL